MKSSLFTMVSPSVSGLDFPSDIFAVRIAMMKQQLARAEPARIDVRKIAPRAAMCGCISPLVRDEHILHIKPHARCQQQRGRQACFGIP